MFLDRCDGSIAARLSDCWCCADGAGHYFISLIIFIIIYCAVVTVIRPIRFSMPRESDMVENMPKNFKQTIMLLLATMQNEKAEARLKRVLLG